MAELRLPDSAFTEITAIPTEGFGAFLGAAAFIATICYPDDYGQRDRFIDHSKAWLAKQAMDARHTRNTGAPELQRIRRRDIDRTIGHATDVLNKRRFPAALIANQMLFLSGVRVTTKKHRDVVVPATVWQLAETNHHTIERAWKQSRPVLHLASAFLAVMWKRQKRIASQAPRSAEALLDEIVSPSLVDLVASPDWLLQALRSAEAQAWYFVHIPNIPNVRGELPPAETRRAFRHWAPDHWPLMVRLVPEENGNHSAQQDNPSPHA